MCFRILGVFCIISCYFECVYRIMCHFLCMWIYFKDIFEHFLKNVQEVWTIFVRNICLWFWRILVLNGPSQHTHTHTHPRRQCQSSLPGEKICKKVLYIDFCDFYENKLKTCTKMITSCSIRRASIIFIFWLTTTPSKTHLDFCFPLLPPS